MLGTFVYKIEKMETRVVLDKDPFAPTGG